MSSDVAAYFDRLRSHLQLGEDGNSEITRELAAHVEDRVAALVRRGIGSEQAQRLALEGFGRPRTLAHLLRQAQHITPWRDALLGASAFAVLAIIVGLQLWQSPFVAVPVAAAIISLTLYGLWLGRPAWFYPWAGVALTLPLLAGYLAFALLQREAEGAGVASSPLALAGVAASGLYFPVGLLVVSAAVIVAVRRDWLDASVLLSPLPGVLVLIVAIHRAGGLTSSAAPVPETASMLFVLYGFMALATVMFLRASTRQARVLLLIGGALVLLAASTVLTDPGSGMVTLAGRGAVLLAFLLSPALVARHA